MRARAGTRAEIVASPVSTFMQRGLLAWVAVLGLSACDEGTSIGTIDPGRIEIDSEIDLGRIYLGDAAQASFSIRALGPGASTYAASFVAPAEGFVLVGGSGTLGAGGQATPTLSYQSGTFVGVGETTLSFAVEGYDPVLVTARVEVLAIPDCEDGNGCTVDSFDRSLGLCTHDAERLPCDDFNDCTVSDFCVDGMCLGEGTSCDDGNVCTEDLCDPQQGCINRLRSNCDDDNPCTVDSCDPVSGCFHRPAEDGTVCGESEVCTLVAACVSGECRRTSFIPDGTECDDGDPCSNSACLQGTCTDPDYMTALPGQLKFETVVGTLAPGSGDNPLLASLLGPDGLPLVHTFTGIEDGVAAVDECGRLAWTSTVGGRPNFGGAVLLPGQMSVPVGAEVVDLSTEGTLGSRVDVASVLAPTSLTGTTSVSIVDMAARASGALVVSVARRSPSGVEGYLVEVDAPHAVATVWRELGPNVARRVAIDADESVVVLLSGLSAGQTAPERLIRFGIGGVSGGTWSYGPLDTVASDLGIGTAGEVLWTAGLQRVGRTGEALTLATPAASAADRRSGSPVVFGPWVWTLEPEGLIARTSISGDLVRSVEASPAPGSSPVVDGSGRLAFVDATGTVRVYDADARPVFSLALPVSGPVSDVALALSSKGVLSVALEGRVFGIQALDGLAVTAWPKHRRDIFGTGHR